MSYTFTALVGYIAWTLFLLVLMEVIRSKIVLTGERNANEFDALNAGLSPFMQRLARALGNCLESFPIFGGLLLVAIAADKVQITDSLALVLLAARIMQSVIHLTSISATAVTIRFTAFAVQMIIAAYWCYLFLMN
ncbi:MAPEG family protein [Aliikangiella marina]|uniref:MAPEG family protein n=1 Tax=Aliikangiella marina TaxID=1712262 RepID=A0A545T9Q2_9GAMM|nr:MAPEG family protein [Aliikangiella marina]TQV73950.1 MAPEG family protein [Aliikangiella marina]